MLLIVLVLVVMLSLGAYTFSELMVSEADATTMFGRAAQARAFADSGIELVAAVLGDTTELADENLYHQPELFQDALRQAVSRRDGRPGRSLEVHGTDQFHVDDQGLLVATPVEQPAHNILFHDGTSARIEIEMANLAENTMAYTMASQLLKNAFEGLRKAIRGQV